MPGPIFLYGDQHDSAGETLRPFLEAAGGTSARIGLLTEGGERSVPYYERISAPWQSRGIKTVHIGPSQRGAEPDAEMVRLLEVCTGIYMCGGDTRIYERIYVHSMLGDIIRKMYASGVPYAGVSAGALLAAEKCATWGGIVTAPDNEYYVRYRGAYDGAEGDISLKMGEGLGLLTGCLVEPHFSELGGFPRLLTIMEWTGIKTGYGLDEPICLVIRDNRPKQVLGRGRLYHVRHLPSGRFEVTVYAPGDQIEEDDRR